MEVGIDKDLIGDPGGRKRVERDNRSRKTKRRVRKANSVFDAGCNERGTCLESLTPRAFSLVALCSKVETDPAEAIRAFSVRTIVHPAGRCLRAGKVNGDQETRLRETADFALLNESTFRSRYAIQRKLSHELIFPTRQERRIIRAAGKPNLMKIARQIQFIVIERPKVTNKRSITVIKIIQLNGSG